MVVEIVFKKEKVGIKSAGHISFIAEVEGIDVPCIVRTCALNKLDPNRDVDIPFFNENRYIFEPIAENKINEEIAKRIKYSEMNIVILENDI